MGTGRTGGGPLAPGPALPQAARSGPCPPGQHGPGRPAQAATCSRAHVARTCPPGRLASEASWAFACVQPSGLHWAAEAPWTGNPPGRQRSACPCVLGAQGQLALPGPPGHTGCSAQLRGGAWGPSVISRGTARLAEGRSRHSPISAPEGRTAPHGLRLLRVPPTPGQEAGGAGQCPGCHRQCAGCGPRRAAAARGALAEGRGSPRLLSLLAQFRLQRRCPA